MAMVLLFVFHQNLSLAQSAAHGGQVEVTVDFESAQAICHLLSGKKADTAQLTRVARLNGNTLLIRKVKSYSNSGETAFKATLKEIIETGTIKGDDYYDWKSVKNNLAGVTQLLNYLSLNKNSFVADIKNIIQPFTPDTLHAKVNACFLVGGGALGFTFNQDPGFYVALQKIGNDVNGLKYLVAHELYHTLQHAGQQTRQKLSAVKPPYPILASYYLLYNLWAEGTATYVGEMPKIATPAAFAKTQVDEYQKNADRKGSNFQLFEALLYRQYNDSTAQYQDLYDVGFSTGFDESSYYVGYQMVKKLIQYSGNTAVANLLVQDPLTFTANYINLYKAHPDDKLLNRFSAPIEQIVQKLMVWRDKL